MSNFRVKALRGFTEYVSGRGMVVFAAERKADSASGVKAREATQDELPEAVAIDREDRGYVQIIGEGSSGSKKTPADRRRERKLAAREARREQPVVSDTGGSGISEAEGELGGHNAGDREALAERQDDLNRGEREGEPGAIIADGPGTQSASTPFSQAVEQSGAEGELSGVSANAIGDGASSVLPENALNEALDARRTATHGQRERRTRAPRKPRAKRAAPKPSGGETETPADAPVE